MSDRQAGESPPRSRWKSWRARPHVSRMPGSQTRHRAIRCRKNCGIPCWPIRAPPAGRRCRSSNAASRKFRDTCCASNACAALASSKSRRPMRSDFMDRMPSGRMSASGCSTRLAATAQAGTRKTDAGRIGADEPNRPIPIGWRFWRRSASERASTNSEFCRDHQLSLSRHGHAIWLVVYLNISEYDIRQKETEKRSLKRRIAMRQLFCNLCAVEGQALLKAAVQARNFINQRLDPILQASFDQTRRL
jgi:hypothetical protein